MPTWDESRLKDPGVDLRRQLATIRARLNRQRITDPQPTYEANESPRMNTVIDSQPLKIEKE
jgi:hypothetical protein